MKICTDFNISFFRYIFALCGFIGTALFAVTPFDAQAQENKPSIRLTPSAVYMSSADVGDGDGSMAVATGRLDVNWRFLSASYSRSDYSWENVGQLAFGNGVDDPWDTLHRLRLSGGHRGEINEDWAYDASLTLTSSFEEEMSDSYGAALRGGLGYTVDEDWTILGGVALTTNHLRSKIMPTVGAAYDGLNDKGEGWKGFIGMPTANIGYHFDKTMNLRFDIGSQGTMARLADDSTVSQKGFVETSGWKSGLYFNWEPTQNFRLTAGPEYTFGRKVKIFRNNGDKIADEDVDASYGGILRVRLAF